MGEQADCRKMAAMCGRSRLRRKTSSVYIYIYGWNNMAACCLHNEIWLCFNVWMKTWALNRQRGSVRTVADKQKRPQAPVDQTPQRAPCRSCLGCVYVSEPPQTWRSRTVCCGASEWLGPTERTPRKSTVWTSVRMGNTRYPAATTTASCCMTSRRES